MDNTFPHISSFTRSSPCMRACARARYELVACASMLHDSRDIENKPFHCRVQIKRPSGSYWQIWVGSSRAIGEWWLILHSQKKDRIVKFDEVKVWMIALSNRIHESFRLFFSQSHSLWLQSTHLSTLKSREMRNERVMENTGLRVTQRENWGKDDWQRQAFERIVAKIDIIQS